ncbi:hypothetical protein ACNUDN_30425 [Mycobacterium sp. smrl_JER01]|uniref:hypothetical protein n=1 Tax=Mycobacterium sp. smrl_JER01 TaxID=3402633 RepID=UPI003AD42C8C
MIRTLAVTFAASASIAFSMAAAAAASPAVQAQEDQPGWDCRTMGNHECGPANSQGVPAGRYEGGVLVQAWDTDR